MAAELGHDAGGKVLHHRTYFSQRRGQFERAGQASHDGVHLAGNQGQIDFTQAQQGMPERDHDSAVGLGQGAHGYRADVPANQAHPHGCAGLHSFGQRARQFFPAAAARAHRNQSEGTQAFAQVAHASVRDARNG